MNESYASEKVAAGEEHEDAPEIWRTGKEFAQILADASVAANVENRNQNGYAIGYSAKNILVIGFIDRKSAEYRLRPNTRLAEYPMHEQLASMRHAVAYYCRNKSEEVATRWVVEAEARFIDRLLTAAKD